MNQTEHRAARVEALAVQALLYEAAATPKPGLVDRANTGAHRDMDFYTFIRSAVALGPAFRACFLAGAAHEGATADLLPEIRRIGMQGERAMLDATGGVNTHKGALFSLGILCAAAGLADRTPADSLSAEALCDLGAGITAGILERDFSSPCGDGPRTVGERLYAQYGLTGIRGEVAGGFQTLRKTALPVIRQRWAQDDLNTLLTDLLLRLMTETEDSNVVGRHDPAMLTLVQEKAAAILALGGAYTPEGLRALEAFDAWCIRQWVSPGGSADLLAVTVFLQLLELSASNVKI